MARRTRWTLLGAVVVAGAFGLSGCDSQLVEPDARLEAEGAAAYEYGAMNLRAYATTSTYDIHAGQTTRIWADLRSDAHFQRTISYRSWAEGTSGHTSWSNWFDALGGSERTIDRYSSIAVPVDVRVTTSRPVLGQTGYVHLRAHALDRPQDSTWIHMHVRIASVPNNAPGLRTVGANMSCYPGSGGTAYLEVENRTGATRTLALSSTSANQWATPGSGFSLTLNPYEKRTVSTSFSISSKAVAGTSIRITTTARDQTSGLTASTSYGCSVQTYYRQPTVTAPPSGLFYEPGDRPTLYFRVKNNSNTSVWFTFDATTSNGAVLASLGDPSSRYIGAFEEVSIPAAYEARQTGESMAGLTVNSPYFSTGVTATTKVYVSGRDGPEIIPY